MCLFPMCNEAKYAYVFLIIRGSIRFPPCQQVDFIVWREQDINNMNPNQANCCSGPIILFHWGIYVCRRDHTIANHLFYIHWRDCSHEILMCNIIQHKYEHVALMKEHTWTDSHLTASVLECKCYASNFTFLALGCWYSYFYIAAIALLLPLTI